MIVVVVVLAGRLVLWIYRGDALVCEAPLSRNRGLLLVTDPVNALLLPEVPA
jgi:hypothetical protein